MDSVMLGSLYTYRRWIRETTHKETLSLFSHGCAGAMAGFTVSFLAAPIEHIKVFPYPKNILIIGAIASPIFIKRSKIYRTSRRIQENRNTFPSNPDLL
jgi:hypothetical protein